MSVTEPTRILTVNWTPAVNIGFLPQEPEHEADTLLTVDWRPKTGTSFLPYDPADAMPPSQAGPPRP